MGGRGLKTKNSCIDTDKKRFFGTYYERVNYKIKIVMSCVTNSDIAGDTNSDIAGDNFPGKKDELVVV